MADNQFTAPSSHKPEKNRTLVKIGEKKPVLDVELNEMQEIQNHLRAEMYRAMVHSGILNPTTIFYNNFADSNISDQNRYFSGKGNNSNAFQMEALKALINGYMINVKGLKAPSDTADWKGNFIRIDEPPTFGTRDDLVFLEAWFEDIDTVKDPTLIDSRVQAETARRVELKWRIRTVAGVDFSKYPEGLNTPQSGSIIGTYPMAQGGNNQPLEPVINWATSNFLSAYERKNYGLLSPDDVGLHIAGNGTQVSKDLLKTADGYVYAIPLFRVKRRNSGGYREDNLNGARDYFEISPKVATGSVNYPVGTAFDIDVVNGSLAQAGDVFKVTGGSQQFTVISKGLGDTLKLVYSQDFTGWSTTTKFGLVSNRPDGKFSNIIDKDDIIDLRHKVSLTGYNYQQLLEENFDKLLRGELQTKDKPNMVKERFGLTPAPLGVKKQLLPTTIKCDDGVYRDLYNYLYGDQAYPAGKYLHQLNDANLKLKVDGADKSGTNVFQLSKKSTALTSDFVGKISGSTTENAHDFRARTVSTLGSPNVSGDWAIRTQADIDKVKSIDSQTALTASSGNLIQSQHLFSFDLIAHVERKYGITLSGTTADKVQWLKDNLKTLTVNWHGKGSSPLGNKGVTSLWSGSTWNYGSTHTNATVTKLSTSVPISTHIMSDGFVHMLAYAEPSNGTIASIIETDYVSLDVELHAHSSALEPTQPYAVLTDDFTGKVSGSVVENPNTFKGSSTSSLQPPTGIWAEATTFLLDPIKSFGGSTSTYAEVTNNGFIAQHLFSFNLIEIVERKYGKIPAGDTAGKVQWLKDNLKGVTSQWYGKGSSPSGNKATLALWEGANNLWNTSFRPTHTSSSVSLLQRGTEAISVVVDANGFVHFLAYAETSDGVTASKIETDYINIIVELKPTAKVLDPKSTVYQVSDTDYIAIPSMDATAIANKFPLVKNYPNIGENLQSSPLGLGVLNSGIGTFSSGGSNLTTLDFVKVEPSIMYQLQKLTSGTWNPRVFEYDSNKAYIKDYLVTKTFTTSSNTQYIKFHDGNSKLEDLVILSKAVNAEGVFVPYGRWLLPTDTASNETPTRISDFTNHNHRRSWGDPQLSDTVSEIIDPVKTPQPHITVTQATSGQWSANDTIKIKSDNGFITGVLDSDTSLAKIIGYADGKTHWQETSSPKNQLKLDKVTGFAVNDSIMLMMWDGSASGVRTITAIDTVNNIITINSDFNSSVMNEYAVFETTASTSSPVYITNATLSFSGLGTKEITATIVTAPTDIKSNIGLKYSVNYPSGKGIINVPSEVLQSEVNGQKLVKASDSIVRIKANFEGKVIGNTDLVPHKSYRKEDSALNSPSSFVVGDDSSQYNNLGKLDGQLVVKSVPGNTQKAQHLFSFNVIRAIEDKLGEQFFNDCLTLADKVAKAKTAVTRMTANWWGKGSSPTGSKSTLGAWNGSWFTWGTHTNASVSKITSNSNVLANYLQSDGFIHFLAYAEPSDGVTASIIETDYIELELELNVAETGYDVLVPEEQFPILVDNPKMFKEGENMIPPFTDPSWILHANAKVLSPYELELNATAILQRSTFIPSLLQNQLYFLSGGDFSIEEYNGGSWVRTIGEVRGSGYFKANASQGNVYRISTFNDNTGKFYFKNPMLTKGDKPKPFVPYNKDVKRKRKMDFSDKIAGSTFENPHKGYYATRPTFNNASDFAGIELGSSSYNAINSLDGKLLPTINNTTGVFSQHLFEFDLSHLGLSLSELKSALRKLTLKWTGYGKGTNGASVGFGSTLKSWDGGAISPKWWDLTPQQPLGTSSPTTVTVTDWGSMVSFINNNQKVYILAHSTYPAGTSSPSEIYTDYISLEVELADYVDYVKGNVVKVRKETKELKLQYPKKSYRSGQDDKVELLYKAIPYQGNSKLGIYPSIKIVSDSPYGHALTKGTGKPSAPDTEVNQNSINRLPLGKSLDDSFFTSEMMAIGLDTGTDYNLPQVLVQKIASAIKSSSGAYRTTSIVGAIINFTGSSEGKRGLNHSGNNIPDAVIKQIYKPIKSSNSKVLYVAPFLGVKEGELVLVIITRTDHFVYADANVSCGIDMFSLDGRPLIKEVN